MVGFAAAMAVRDKLSRPKRSLRLRYGPVCTQRQLLRWNRNVGRTTSEAGDGKERRVLGHIGKAAGGTFAEVVELCVLHVKVQHAPRSRILKDPSKPDHFSFYNRP
jgi:hypothetical protein